MNFDIFSYLIITLIFMVIVIILYRYYNNLEPKVTQNYDCSEGTFNINGRMDNFIIKKNNHLEFLVKNGEIVAVRDIRKDKDFIYYRKENGNV